jgi:hypothetical protein
VRAGAVPCCQIALALTFATRALKACQQAGEFVVFNQNAARIGLK